MFRVSVEDYPPSPIKAAQEEIVSNSYFQLCSRFQIESLHIKSDQQTGLKAIIAIHNSRHGSALGGTRSMPYANETLAVNDVVQLAQGMSYKSAFADLTYGGGKAVLIQPEHIFDRNSYFAAYAELINSLNGKFITAVDVGTSIQDMDVLAQYSDYVLSTSKQRGDPSTSTAQGVLQAIKSALYQHLNQYELNGIHVAIQGLGKVGIKLAQLLYTEGAVLSVSDLNPELTQICADIFQARIIKPENLINTHCDVLAPCALGQVITRQTIASIQAKIICGAANNQLDNPESAEKLHNKGIFYVPDYVANAGGLIHVVTDSIDQRDRKITEIYSAVSDIYQRSKHSTLSPLAVANQIAEEKLSHQMYFRQTHETRR